MTGIILFIIYVITQSTDACALYKESKFDYNISFVNLRLITLRGKHQLVYGIRARSLRPRPHVSGYFFNPKSCGRSIRIFFYLMT